MANTGIKGEHSALWNELAKVDVTSPAYAAQFSEKKDADLVEFLHKHLAGKNVSDLITIQNQMLIEAERVRDPLRGVERENFDKEMANVFRHLAVLMRKAPPDPNAKKVERVEPRSADMDAAIQDEAKLRAEREANRAEKQRLAKEPQEETVYQQPPDPVEAKTRLQQIKDVVEAGVKTIRDKTAEVKTNVETKYKIRKAMKEFKGRDPLRILSANANRAIDKIRALGERASASILKLVKKEQAEVSNMEIGPPSDFRKAANPAAALAANAALNTGHASEADAPLPPAPPREAALTREEIDAHGAQPKDSGLPSPPPREAALTQEEIDKHLGEADAPLPPPPPTPKIAAPPEPPPSPAELDDLLKELVSDKMPERASQVKGVDQQAQKDIDEKFDRVVEQLQEDVQEVEQGFAEKAEGLAAREEVDLGFDETALMEQMGELDKAFAELNKAAPEKGAAQAPDPGTPKSDNDSGSSTPRAGH